jgi:hypothetical protein
MKTTTLDEEIIEAIRLLKKNDFFVVNEKSISTLAEPYINLIEPAIDLETRKETRMRLNKALADEYGYRNNRLDISVYNYIIKTVRNKSRKRAMLRYKLSLIELAKRFG